MKCPVCGAVYRSSKGSKESGEQGNHNYVSSSPTCRRCKADLSDLLRLHDQAMWYYEQAIHLLMQGNYLEATAHNNQALALYYNHADFHALAGKLSALQGEFRDAIRYWQQALRFDQGNIIASHGLEMIKLLQESIEVEP